MTPKCPDCKRDQDDCICAIPASAPEGWKLVPVEPTDAMIESGCRALGALYGQYGASEAYRAMLSAAPIPPENKALLEAVAEVVWYDPQLSHFPEKPGKIIDGSIAFMESAKIGTKLFAAPTPPSTEDRKDAERFREGWTHACNALCMEIALWIERCPHCGMPAPKAPAMQEDKP